MPLEAVGCSNCGSSDVQELKPNLYFCNHCEGQFRFIDPTRITVTQEQAFCECGNPVQFQCYACRTGICEHHDAFNGGLKVPGVVSSFVAREIGTAPPHLCSVCLEPLVEKLNGLKADARLCSDPSCIDAPETRCGCCHGLMCGRHAALRDFAIAWGGDRSEQVQMRGATPVCTGCHEVIWAALRDVVPYQQHSGARKVTDTVKKNAFDDAQRLLDHLSSKLGA
jgi:hypothetical protein